MPLSCFPGHRTESVLLVPESLFRCRAAGVRDGAAVSDFSWQRTACPPGKRMTGCDDVGTHVRSRIIPVNGTGVRQRLTGGC